MGRYIISFMLLIALSVSSLAQPAGSTLERGIQSFQKGDYATALRQLRQADEQSPNDALTKLWLGLALYANDEFQPAVGAWNAAAGINYQQWAMTADFFIGLAYWSKGDKSRAAFFFDPAVKGHGEELLRRGLQALKEEEPPPFQRWWQIARLPAGSAAEPSTARQPAPANQTSGENAGEVRPVSTRNTSSGTGAGRAPEFGRFNVGDEVLVHTSGTAFSPGRIVEVGKAGTFSDKSYNVKANDGTWWRFYTDVYGPQREPYWTKFFVGDWRVGTVGANNTIANSRGEVFETATGGMRLPPLKINADGTYSWRLLGGKVIDGRWKQRDDAPGIVLLSGENGKDWLLVNKTTKQNLESFPKADVIELHAPGETGYEAYRLSGGKQ